MILCNSTSLMFASDGHQVRIKDIQMAQNFLSYCLLSIASFAEQSD